MLRLSDVSSSWRHELMVKSQEDDKRLICEEMTAFGGGIRCMVVWTSCFRRCRRPQFGLEWCLRSSALQRRGSRALIDLVLSAQPQYITACMGT